MRDTVVGLCVCVHVFLTTLAGMYLVCTSKKNDMVFLVVFSTLDVSEGGMALGGLKVLYQHNIVDRRLLKITPVQVVNRSLTNLTSMLCHVDIACTRMSELVLCDDLEVATELELELELKTNIAPGPPSCKCTGACKTARCP